MTSQLLALFSFHKSHLYSSNPPFSNRNILPSNFFNSKYPRLSFFFCFLCLVLFCFLFDHNLLSVQMFLPVLPTNLSSLLNHVFGPCPFFVFSKSISSFLSLLWSHGPSHWHCLAYNYFHFFSSSRLLAHLLTKPHPPINPTAQLLQGDEHCWMKSHYKLMISSLKEPQFPKHHPLLFPSMATSENCHYPTI